MDREEQAGLPRSKPSGIPRAVFIAFFVSLGCAICIEIFGRRLGYSEFAWRMIGCIPLLALPITVGYTWRGGAWTADGKTLGRFLWCLFFGLVVVITIVDVLRGYEVSAVLSGLLAFLVFWLVGVHIGIAICAVARRRRA